MTGIPSFQTVLFDLDGTLVDTAPDLVASMMVLRQQSGLADADPAVFRHHATRGAVGLLEAGFAGQPDADLNALKAAFLDHYRDNLWVHSRPFAGVEAVLEQLTVAGLRLGIVTNKPEWLTLPLLGQAGWDERFGCVVCGDSVARAKPHPDPVVEACHRLDTELGRCLFVGDDRRDVEAGRAAGVATAVAGWGYLPPGEDGRGWGAEWFFAEPLEMLEMLGMFVGESQE